MTGKHHVYQREIATESSDKWRRKIYFLKILTGKQEPTTGNVSLEPGKRMSVLEQGSFAYDNFTVLETVLRGK